MKGMKLLSLAEAGLLSKADIPTRKGYLPDGDGHGHNIVALLRRLTPLVGEVFQ